MHVKPPHCHKLPKAGSAFEISISLSQDASQSTSSTSLLVEIGRLPRSCSPEATTSSCPRGESIGHNLDNLLGHVGSMFGNSVQFT